MSPPGVRRALSLGCRSAGRHLKIVRPDTVIRRHRAGLRAHWRWSSRRRDRRPRIPADIRQLILKMSVANLLWESVVDLWRTAQVRDRCQPDYSCKTHGKRNVASSRGWASGSISKFGALKVGSSPTILHVGRAPANCGGAD